MAGHATTYQRNAFNQIAMMRPRSAGGVSIWTRVFVAVTGLNVAAPKNTEIAIE